jgi:hypothetical protein
MRAIVSSSCGKYSRKCGRIAAKLQNQRVENVAAYNLEALLHLRSFLAEIVLLRPGDYLGVQIDASGAAVRRRFDPWK